MELLLYVYSFHWAPWPVLLVAGVAVWLVAAVAVAGFVARTVRLRDRAETPVETLPGRHRLPDEYVDGEES